MRRTLPSLVALRAFDAAARHLSFKAAAEELGVTSTAISHRVRDLEGQLGVALFERRVRAVALTEPGTRLAAATAQAFAGLAAAVDEVTDAERVITVTTTPAFAALWLVPKLPEFEVACPGYTLRLDTGTAPADLLRARSVDIAIRYASAGPPPSGLVAAPLAHERVAAYGSPAYLDGLTGFDAAVLIETRWRQPGLVPIDWPAWAHAAGLGRAGVADRTRHFDQEHHAVQAALAGQGLVLVSDLLVADHVTRGWLARYRPEVQLDGLGYTALMTEAQAGSARLRHFVGWLRKSLSVSAH